MNSAINSKLMHRLTYPHGPSRFVELFDRTAVIDETIGTISAIEHPTERSVRVSVRPNNRWNGFLAGQYVEFAMEIDGRRQRRMFSPAQSQHADGALEFTMAVNPDGVLTRHIKSSARVGDHVILGNVGGDFHLPETRPEHVVLISAGSGITPVLSMLRTLIDERYQGTVDFIHYCRSADDALYASELEACEHTLPGLRMHCIHTRAGGARFSAEQLEQMVPNYREAHTFVCGPSALLDATRTLFDEQGIGERLHQEAFGLATHATGEGESGGEIHFKRSDRTTDNNGETLLEQAEHAGLSPQHGCRMGVCFACSCTKTAGRVRDLRTGEVSGDGEEDIQICVSAPMGSVSLDI
ncbi:iron-sulfur cluster-binding domain-containing protein [Endozoicomonas sp. G2_2]|uniref:flavin reductase family protein n=1 Tax=Endozoicomonas sp. G2_2 TaxID=2821092 RepID=UPI001ADD48CA